jgi:hypothetical protein
VYLAMDGQKNPKVATEALRWIETTLPEFGLAGVRVRDLIGFLKAQLESANLAVRQRSTAVLVVLRIAVGPGPSLSGFACVCWHSYAGSATAGKASIASVSLSADEGPPALPQPCRHQGALGGCEAGIADDAAGRV